LRFIEDKRAVYYVGKEAAPKLQLQELMREASRALQRPSLATLEAPSWRAAFEAIVEHLEEGDAPLIIALDEFQWMAAASPELPSVLQELWDRYWSRNGKLMLILCGSLVGFMEREVLGRKSPLFGRRTAQLQLQPFSFREAAKFHPTAAPADLAAVHFVCGGIPAYLAQFDPLASFELNITRGVLEHTAPLFREPDFLLREELRELESYHAILTVLARGSAPVHEIARRTGLKEASLPYYLKQLVELGYVERRYPLTTRKPTRRSVRYGLDDALLRFWFRFVEPNLTFLQQVGPRLTFKERIKPQLAAYFGSCFERLCREALPLLLIEQEIHTGVETGAYWDNAMQIDLVGLREDGPIELGECKWGAYGSATKVESDLADKLSRYPNPSNRRLLPNVFARVKPRRAKDLQLRWWDLDALYGVSGPDRRRSSR
jgi:AAA+ ATPase superfamily predicted ATPase